MLKCDTSHPICSLENDKVHSIGLNSVELYAKCKAPPELFVQFSPRVCTLHILSGSPIKTDFKHGKIVQSGGYSIKQ